MFSIDFYELAFLAEACIPPKPIARTHFWRNITDRYWHQMTEQQRNHLFSWMNRNDWYKESLQNEEYTKVFHARFNPDNQYMVKTNFQEKVEEHRAFLLDGKYYTNHNTWIADEYIINKTKLDLSEHILS